MHREMLIADIGGTSSRWAYLRKGAEPLFLGNFPGYNPAVGEPDALLEALRSTLPPQGLAEAPEVHVYGAGCGDPQRRERMVAAMRGYRSDAVVHVTTDLEGAALATCGTEPGLVLILGTGMNVGYFDGRTLHRPMPSLGYVLGDEGSGADLGKLLYHAYFTGAMPDEVKRRVFEEPVILAEALERIHRGPDPQAWLAKPVAAAATMLDHDWVRELVEERFERLVELIERYFVYPERRNVHAVGSVAHGLQDALGPVLAGHGMRLAEVLREPLPGLVRYHAARMA